MISVALKYFIADFCLDKMMDPIVNMLAGRPRLGQIPIGVRLKYLTTVMHDPSGDVESIVNEYFAVVVTKCVNGKYHARYEKSMTSIRTKSHEFAVKLSKYYDKKNLMVAGSIIMVEDWDGEFSFFEEQVDCFM